MQIVYVLAALLLAGAVCALAAVAFAYRRTKSDAAAMQTRLLDAELNVAALRDEKAGVERDLAVEQQKASRIPALESDAAALLAKLEKTMQDKADLGSKLGEEAAAVAHTTQAFARLEQEHARLAAELAAKRNESQEQATKLAKLGESFDQEKRQAGEKLALLQNAREQMTTEFKNLANEVMTRHGEVFSKQNKEQIDLTLTPLREKITEFQQSLLTAHTDSVTGRALLTAKIAQLSEDSAKVRSEAESLATALRGESQMRGAWGEMILDSVLTKSGLVKGDQYLTQQTYRTADGRDLRADVVVPLPNEQSFVIDSKVSLVAFRDYVNAADEEPRAASLQAHVSAMRKQISDLSGKAYQAVVPGSLDFVIMFVPIEAALAAALQADRKMIDFAVESRVALATPTTLLVALRTAADVWRVENRNRNAEAIATRAGQLYDKLVSFVGDMETLNRKLGEAQSACDSAMKRLATGGGNLVRQAEMLKGMGAKATKSLPSALLDGASTPHAAADGAPATAAP